MIYENVAKLRNIRNKNKFLTIFNKKSYPGNYSGTLLRLKAFKFKSVGQRPAKIFQLSSVSAPMGVAHRY